MVTLQNDQLRVEIATLGAEITSIKGANGVDYILDNPEFWGDHAPNLFPVIGRLNDYKHVKDGEEYEIPQHGFAKISEFEVVTQGDSLASFQLKASEETKKGYPWDFTLTIHYSLEGSSVKVSYEVSNHSDELMPYAVGGHPAFNIPLDGAGTFSDYQLTIDPAINADYFVSDPVPWLSGEKAPFEALKDGVIELDHEIWRDGLIIIDNQDIETVTLSSDKTDHGVRVHMAEFPYLCLWTKDDMDAPFLCIEPFHGLPDVDGEPGQLVDKEGMIILAPGETNTTSFTIEIF